MTPEQLAVLKTLRQLQFFVADGKYTVRVYSVFPTRTYARAFYGVDAVLAHAQTIVRECGGNWLDMPDGTDDFVTSYIGECKEGSSCIVEFKCVPELCEKFLLDHGYTTSLSELDKQL